MRILLIAFVLLISGCSQKSSKAKIGFSKLGFLANAANYHGGIKIWGVESNQQLSFSISMLGENDQKQIELPVGSWEFFAVGWDGNGAANSYLYEGAVKCGSATKTLAVADESVYITLASTSCADYFSMADYNINGQFKPLELVSCNDSSVPADSSSNCSGVNLGQARSYLISMPDFTPSTLYPTAAIMRPYTFPMSGRCFSDGNNDSVTPTTIKLPQGTFAMSPLVVGIKSFSSNDCSGTPLSGRLYQKNLMVPDPAITYSTMSFNSSSSRIFLEDIIAPSDLPASLDFTSFPSNITTGYNFGFGVQLKKSDNTNYTGPSNYTVALSAHSTPVTCTGAIGGTLLGTITQTTSAGVASFSSLSYNFSQTVYIKAIVTGPNGINFGVCSSGITFSVAGGADHHLSFYTQPVTSALLGTTMPQLDVNIEDITSVQTSSTSTVTLTPYQDGICSIPASITVSGSGMTAATGRAMFGNFKFLSGDTGIYYLKAESGALISTCSNSITVSRADSAYRLAFTTQPPASATVNTAMPSFTVQIQNSGSTVASSATDIVTLFACSNSDCSSCTAAPLNADTMTAATGNATFSSRSFTSSGNYYLKAHVAGLIKACSQAINVTPSSSIDHIDFNSLASNVQDNVLIPSFNVRMLDAAQSLVSTPSRTVTLTAHPAAGCTGGTLALTGTTSLATSGGLATFSSVVYDHLTGDRGEFFLKATIDVENFTTCRRVVVNRCPANYVYVEANPIMGTFKDFCVAKYEMRSGASVSASGAPDSSLSPSVAKSACVGLAGGSYDLISNAEWMSVARSIELNTLNWAPLATGHSNGVPSSAQAANEIDDFPCAYTADAGATPFDTCGVGGAQKRTQTLLNGEIIWDFAGNLSEWVDMDPITAGVQAMAGQSFAYLTNSSAYTVFASIGTLAYLDLFSFAPSDINFSFTEGVGTYTWSYLTSGYVARGGAYNHGTDSGIYYLNASYTTDVAVPGSVGYRCTYHPSFALNTGNQLTPQVYDVMSLLNDDYAVATAIDIDGNILTVGQHYNSGEWHGYIRKYLASDLSSFGAPPANWDFGSAGENLSLSDILVDDAGRVLVAGAITNLGETDLAIWRFMPNGILDVTFGGSGLVMINGTAGYNGGIQVAHAIAIDRHKRIVIAGVANSGIAESPAIWRLNDDGTLQTSLFMNSSISGELNDVVIKKDNSIVTVGNRLDESEIHLWRVNLDALSVVQTTEPCSYCSGLSISLAPSESELYVVGTAESSAGNKDALVLKYNNIAATPQLDVSFDVDGRRYLHSGLDDHGIRGALGSGGLYVLGESFSVESKTYVWSVNLSTGTLQGSFSADGIVEVYTPTTHEYADDFVINGFGEIFVAGSVEGGGDSNSRILKIFGP